MRADPRGSIWRRWDLHIHTPASFDYQNGSITAEKLVSGLIDSGVAVAAITDHHTLDVPLIKEMQRLAGDALTLLPGIELRSELGGSESVHYIGIFSEKSDLDELWTKLQQLGITPTEVKRKGDESVFVAFERGCALIRELGGIVTVHAGQKSNSIESLSNADVVKRAVKTEYVYNFSFR